MLVVKIGGGDTLDHDLIARDLAGLWHGAGGSSLSTAARPPPTG